MRKSKTMTKAQLADQLHAKLGFSKTEANALLASFLDVIGEALAKGEMVNLPSFGQFRVLDKKPRVARNPRTGATAMVSARKVVVFKASKALRQKDKDS